MTDTTIIHHIGTAPERNLVYYVTFWVPVTGAVTIHFTSFVRFLVSIRLINGAVFDNDRRLNIC